MCLPEGENGEGPVGLVAGNVGHRGAPKIVGEDMANGVDCQNVLIKSHCRDIIVHEIAIKTVQVASDGDGAH